MSPRRTQSFKWMSTFRTYTVRPRVDALLSWCVNEDKIKANELNETNVVIVVLIVACELGQMVPIRGVVGRTEGRIIKSFVSIHTPIIVTSASQDRTSRYYHIAEDCKHLLYVTNTLTLVVKRWIRISRKIFMNASRKKSTFKAQCVFFSCNIKCTFLFSLITYEKRRSCHL